MIKYKIKFNFFNEFVIIKYDPFLNENFIFFNICINIQNYGIPLMEC
jgi:hypothetical protein